MKLPTWQPRDRQMSERRHYDPPALWYAVILGSVAIHLSAFGILRLLIGTASATKLIPIDVIAIASSKPNTTSTASKNSTTASNQTQNRKSTSSTSSPTRTKKQPGTTQKPAANTEKSSASSTSKPARQVPPKTQPNTPTDKNNQPSTGQNNQPGGTTTPNSSSPTNSPTNQPSSNPQSVGGFITTFNNLAPSANIEILNQDLDNIKFATLLDDKKQLSTEELKQLGISLEQILILKVVVLVETNGTATVPDDTEKEKSVLVEQGRISQQEAVALAKKISSQLRFSPTLVNGKPMPANYNLQFTIRPAPK